MDFASSLQSLMAVKENQKLKPVNGIDFHYHYLGFDYNHHKRQNCTYITLFPLDRTIIHFTLFPVDRTIIHSTLVPVDRSILHSTPGFEQADKTTGVVRHPAHHYRSLGKG